MVVSLFTPKYQAYADNLKQDLDQFGIKYDVQEYPDQGDYISNHLLKPEHIQRMLVEGETDSLWLDIDSRVHAPFDYIDKEFKGDIGAVMFKNNHCGSRKNPQKILYPTMCTATMYLRNIQPVRDLVDTWEENLNPQKDDCSLVQYDWNKLVLPVIEKGEIIFEELPFPYCWVDSGDAEKMKLLKTTKPIVEQYYANRKFRSRT